jgi:hypothetical protein
VRDITLPENPVFSLLFFLAKVLDTQFGKVQGFWRQQTKRKGWKPCISEEMIALIKPMGLISRLGK